MNDLNGFTPKQQELLNALKSLPLLEDSFYEKEFLRKQREGMIICIMLDAIQCDYVDEALEIVSKNNDKTVFDIMKILVDRGISSSVEIVDDDVLDDE